MYINLVLTMREKGIRDADIAAQLEMSEVDFIDRKVGLLQFTRCERLAVALILGYPASWLFERV